MVVTICLGTDIQYFEARANGNVSYWDYRGDSYQNGQDCYVKSIAFFRYGGGSVIDVYGESIEVDIDMVARQVTFNDAEGLVEFPRLDNVSSVDFDICGAEANNFGLIPGLWDVTLDDDIQYFEATEDGNVTLWDYQLDGFNNGLDCYVKSSSYFQIEGDMTIEVNGEGIAVNVNTSGAKVTFTDSEGTVNFPRVIGITSSEFVECG